MTFDPARLPPLLATGGWLLGKRREAELVWRRMHWPQELDPEMALRLLRQLAADRRNRLLVFEAEATRSGIEYRVATEPAAGQHSERLLRALVPGLELTRTSHPKRSGAVVSLRLSSNRIPLRSDDPAGVSRALLAALSMVDRDERLAVRWLLGRRHQPRPGSEQADSIWEALFGSSSTSDATRRRALAAKGREHAFSCQAQVVASAAGAARERALINGLLAAIRTAEAATVTVHARRQRWSCHSRPLRWPLRLTVSELLGLTAWPIGNGSLPGINRERRLLRADPTVAAGGRVVARVTAPGEEGTLGLSITDAMQHLHLLGPTGVGKSTLLLNLIVQDLREGRGLVVVDPKGDLVDDILARIPAGRERDIVVLDPTDTERPVGLNPLANSESRTELIADQVLAVFHGLYESSWGPRTQDILHASLLSLAGRRDTTLCALPVLLTNQAVRRRLLRDVDDPIALGPFWGWFEGLSEGERHQVIAPLQNKLRPFLLRKRVRAIVGQTRPRFQLDQVFTRQKVLLVSLAKGTLGPEASALLGSLLVAQLWHTALQRITVPPGQRRPVTVFLDEFQNFLHLPTDLADTLAQARGLSVGLTLAHQHLAQLSTEVRAAVLANARSRVCFQLAADDATQIARHASPLHAEDFQRLPRHEVYASLVARGEVTPYASGHTLPPPPRNSNPAWIRELSRLRYGKPVAEVEAEIRAISQPGHDDERIGTRPRRSD